jgi:surfeit locus 1 family protein
VSYLAWTLYETGRGQQSAVERRNLNLHLPPVPLPYNPTAAELEALDHRQVFVTGEFLHERELRVVPRYFESQLGLYIFTPLRRPDGSIVIINRGWVPAQLQDPETRIEAQVEDKVTILGHLIPGGEPNPIKFFSDKPLWEVVNAPERNIWPRVDVQEMADWVNSQPILISALANPPNPGGYPIGGQTDLQTKNTTLIQSYQYAALAAGMALSIVGGRYFRRLGLRFPWQKNPPSHTPFYVKK